MLTHGRIISKLVYSQDQHYCVLELVEKKRYIPSNSVKSALKVTRMDELIHSMYYTGSGKISKLFLIWRNGPKKLCSHQMYDVLEWPLQWVKYSIEVKVHLCMDPMLSYEKKMLCQFRNEMNANLN